MRDRWFFIFAPALILIPGAAICLIYLGLSWAFADESKALICREKIKNIMTCEDWGKNVFDTPAPSVHNGRITVPPKRSAVILRYLDSHGNVQFEREIDVVPGYILEWKFR